MCYRKPRFAARFHDKTSKSKVSGPKYSKPSKCLEYLTLEDFATRRHSCPTDITTILAYKKAVQNGDPSVIFNPSQSNLSKELSSTQSVIAANDDEKFMSFDEYFAKSSKLTRNRASKIYSSLLKKGDSSLLRKISQPAPQTTEDFFLDVPIEVPLPVVRKESKPVPPPVTEPTNPVEMRISMNAFGVSPDVSDIEVPSSVPKPKFFLSEESDDETWLEEDMPKRLATYKKTVYPVVPAPVTPELDEKIETPVESKTRSGKDLATVNRLKREAHKRRQQEKVSATRVKKPVDEYDAVKSQGKVSKRHLFRNAARSGVFYDFDEIPLAEEEVKEIMRSSKSFAKKVRARPKKSVSESDRKARDESNVLRQAKIVRKRVARDSKRKIDKPVVEIGSDVEEFFDVPLSPYEFPEDVVEPEMKSVFSDRSWSIRRPLSEPLVEPLRADHFVRDIANVPYEEITPEEQIPASMYSKLLERGKLLYKSFSVSDSTAAHADKFANLVCFLYLAIKHRDSPMSVSAAMYLYGSTLDMSIVKKAGFAALVGSCSYLFCTSSVEATDELVLPSVEAGQVTDAVQGLFDIFLYTFDSSASKAIRDFVVGCACLKMFSSDHTKRIHRHLGDHGKTTTIGLIQICINAVIKLIRISELVLSGVPISQAVMAVDPKGKAFTEAQFCLRFKDLTYAGLPVPGYIDRTTWMMQAVPAKVALESVLKITAPTQPDFQVLTNMVQELSAAIAIVGGLSAGSERQTPFAIINVGDPGIGKASLNPFYFAVHCELKNRIYSQDLVYPRVKNSDYWDGYNPDANPYVFISEVATVHASRAKNQGDPSMDELTTVVDSMKCYANMSDVKDKGKYLIRPEMVVADTNTEHLNLTGSVNNPAAFRRRFLFIEPIVKQEYRKAKSCQLDFAKTNDGKRHLDRWLFKVWRYESVDSVSSNRVWYMDGKPTDDIDKLHDVLIQMMYNHIMHQDVMRQRRESENFTGYGNLTLTALPDAPPSVPDDNFSKHAAMVKAHGKKHVDEKQMVMNLTFPHDIRWNNVVADCRAFVMMCAVCKRNRTSGSPPSGPNGPNGGPNGPDGGPNDGSDAGDNDNNNYVEDIGSPPIIDPPPIPSDDEDDKKDDPSAPLISPVPQFFFRVNIPLIDRMRFAAPYIMASFKEESYSCLVSFFNFIGKFTRPGSKIGPTIAFLSSIGINIASFKYLPWYCGVFGISGTICTAFAYALASRLLRRNRANLAEQAVARVAVTRSNLRYALGLSQDASNAHVALAAARDLSVLLVMASVVGKIAEFVTTVVRPKPKIIYVAEDSLPPTPEFPEEKIIRKPKNEMHTVFPRINDDITKLQDIEEKTGSCIPYARVDNKLAINPEWNVAVGIPPLYNGGIGDFVDLVYRNVRRVSVELSNGKSVETNVLGICSNYALINRHALDENYDKPGVQMMIVVFPQGQTAPNKVLGSMIDSTSIVHVRDDVCLVSLSSVTFRSIIKHITADLVLPQMTEAFVKSSMTKAFLVNHSYRVKSRAGFHMASLDWVYQYPLSGHKSGDCGSPLIVEKGNGYVVAGIHSVGSTENVYCAASLVSQNDIRKAVATLQGTSPFIALYSPSLRPETFLLPHTKSPFRHETLHGLTLLGKLNRSILINDKSSVRSTKLFNAGIIDNLFKKHIDFVPTIQYGPPLMKPVRFMVDDEIEYVSPYNVNIVNMNKQKQPLNRKVLRKCIDVFKKRIVDGLRKKGVKKLSPYVVREAINGDPCDPFLRRIDASKSAGYGWTGAKSAHLPDSKESDSYPVRLPTDKLVKKLVDTVEGYLNEETQGQVFSAQLKDEPRDTKKYVAGKTRLFMVSAVDGLVLSRMFLGPFYTLMVQFNDIFCTAIGTDMHMNAQSVYDRLTSFSDKIMELDYKNYDQAMPFDIGWAVATLIHEVLEEFGYNKDALKVVDGLLTDSLFPIVELLTDVFIAAGYQPSGKYATAEDNSLRGIFLLMYAWYSHPVLCRYDFFSSCCPIVYGDDLLMAVLYKFRKYMNNVTYTAFCELHYLMTCTPASKDGVMREYVKPSEMSFLKRTFVVDDRFARVVAPLDLNSLHKTLSWYVSSNSVTEVEQTISACNSVMRELMFHLNKKTHDKFRAEWIASFSELYEFDAVRVSAMIHQYDDLLLSLTGGKTTLVSREIRDDLDELEEFSSGESSTASESKEVCEVPTDYSSKDSVIIGQISDDPRPATDLFIELEKERELLASEVKEYLDEFDSIRNSSQLADPKLAEKYAKVQKFKAIESTLHLLATRKVTNPRVESNMGDQHEGPVEANVVQHVENVTEIAGHAPTTVSYGMMSSSSIMKDVDVSLDEFFSRPIEIDQFALSAPVTKIYDIWAEYLRNPTVRAKLKNYGFLRANLNVEISVSGTPFHYGRLFCGYIPWPAQNLSASQLSAYTSGTTVRYISGTKNVKRINVCDNTPHHMEFPYISPQPMMRLFNEASVLIGANVDFEDAAGMGSLILATWDTIGCVTTGATDPYVYIYAWLSDYSLGCPTGTILSLTSESEEKTGPVSMALNNLSKLADGLKQIPVINDYAHASSVVLKSLSTFSANYGWSYPVNNNYASRMKNEPYQNSANTIGLSTAQHVTLTPNQGLTVDPRVVGTSEDEMSFAAFTTREGMLTKFVWTAISPPMTTIFHTKVSPYAMEKSAENSGIVLIMPPVSYVASMFQFWRGDMIYKFDFVCSKFHRGKIAILFEPNLAQNVIIEGALSLNKQYVMIVDLQETQTIEFCVKWAKQRAWTTAETTYTANSLTHSNPDSFNGFLTVFPITRLQSPDSSDVVVYVSTKADNMMFNVRGSDYFNDFVVESSVVEVSCEDLNPTGAGLAHIVDEHFGEVPVSFRSLFKRFMTRKVDDSSVTSLPRGHLWRTYTIYPSSVSSSVGLFDHVRRAFLGMRGGMTYRIAVCGSGTVGPLSIAQVSLESGSTNNTESGGYNDSSITMATNGTVQFVPNTNGGFEFHVPMYTNNLFAFAYTPDRDPYPDISVIEKFCPRKFLIEIEMQCTTVRTTSSFATAEDFSLLYLIAPPVLDGA